ncbi:hypothetical protein B0I35DRAFT_5903 [Stachybotrys elegans]|uniref:Uncharacterized protein n=1 Tax=Stachybotrys elegans TaxID=80388 RepID=A0A8K0WVU7_9HYPO|nr:hypothetical protein B0I35DRAFT_5903 [Stachybotrys elegans]
MGNRVGPSSSCIFDGQAPTGSQPASIHLSQHTYPIDQAGGGREDNSTLNGGLRRSIEARPGQATLVCITPLYVQQRSRRTRESTMIWTLLYLIRDAIAAIHSLSGPPSTPYRHPTRRAVLCAAACPNWPMGFLPMGTNGRGVPGLFSRTGAGPCCRTQPAPASSQASQFTTCSHACRGIAYPLLHGKPAWPARSGMRVAYQCAATCSLGVSCSLGES